MVKNLTISVIVPCYNQAQYMDECLQSVLDQTYQEWECIIVNDGSPDNTEEVAKKWIEKDSRFHYYKKENGGVASARNFGIERAKGEWILPLDGDDKIGLNYLELASLEFDKEYDIVYSHAEYFGTQSGKMELPKFDEKRLLVENQIFCTSFFRKNSWELIGGFDETMLDGYEDWEFWIHFLAKKKHLRVHQIETVGLYYRIKPISRNTEAIQNFDIELREKIYRKHLDLFFAKIPFFLELNQENKSLKRQNIYLRKKTEAPRYKMIDKILRLIGK